jgi:hypothetical protein
LVSVAPSRSAIIKYPFFRYLRAGGNGMEHVAAYTSFTSNIMSTKE